MARDGKLRYVSRCKAFAAAFVVAGTTMLESNLSGLAKEDSRGASPSVPGRDSRAQAGTPPISRELANRLNHASTLCKENRITDAMTELNSIIGSHPDCWDAYVRRANAEQLLGRYGQALRDLRIAEDHEPLNAGALFVRGTCNLNLDRWKLAQADAEKAIALDPGNSRGWALRDQTLMMVWSPDALKATQDMVTKFPREVDMLKLCVMAAIKSTSWPSLELLLRTLNKADSGNPAWHTQLVNLGELRDEMMTVRTRLPKASDAAIAQLSADVAKNPHDVTPLMIRGAYYLKNLDAEHAVADFTAVIKIEPKRVWAYTRRGVAYRSLEKFDKSFADFAQARKINPLSTDAGLECARLHKTLHQYPQAIAVYDELVRSRPDSSLILLERCQTYLDANKPESALADADKLVSMKREFAELKTRGEALSACGKYKEAIEDYTSALAIKPGDPKVLNGRARAYRKSGDIAHALEDERGVKSFNDEIFEEAPFRHPN